MNDTVHRVLERARRAGWKEVQDGLEEKIPGSQPGKKVGVENASVS